MYKLYVFARSDLDSLNPGKLAAQVAHAASMVAKNAYGCSENSIYRSAYKEWENSGGGFGTTIVLDAHDLTEIGFSDNGNCLVVSGELDKSDPLMYGVVHDPSYPVRDGNYIHHVPLTTCFWAFEDPEKNSSFGRYVSKFNLY